MKTIVSVTPIAVEGDSRTFKEAASFARLGYRSIVVEGGHSAFSRQGLPFELVSVGGPAGASGLATAPAKNHRAVVEMLRRFYGPLRWLRGVNAERRRTTPLLPSADLYVLHEYAQYPAVRAACRRHGVHFVYDAHDLYSTLISEQRLQPYFSRSAHELKGIMERRCVRSAAACITVAPRLAELQRERFGRSFSVVRNAHDPRLDRATDVSVRQASRAVPDDVLAVVIGNAKPAIAFPKTLEAIAQLPAGAGVHLACVGRGYERFAGEVERLGLGDRVSFTGAVAPVEVASFLRDADLALALYTPTNISVFNALPNGFFQAVAAGLPMIYAPLPEIEALAERYDLGVEADPTDSAAVAAQISSLAADRPRLEELRSNATKAAPELSWEHEETALAEVVERAMGA